MNKYRRLTPNKKTREDMKISFSNDWQTNEICLKCAEIEDFEEKVKFDTRIIFKACMDGFWAKWNNQISFIEPDDVNVSIRDGFIIIQELYFEDLDCVMDTTGKRWYLLFS